MKNELKAKIKNEVKNVKERQKSIVSSQGKNMEYYGSYADNINTAETHEVFVKDRKKILS